MEVLELIVRFAGAGLTLLLTAALVGATIYYALTTARIYKANARAVEATLAQTLAITRPYIVVSAFMPPGSDRVYLRVANKGRSLAENLELTLDGPVPRSGHDKTEGDLSSYRAFRQPIVSFAPGAQLDFYITDREFVRGDAEVETPKVFSVTAEYAYLEHRFTERTTVELAIFDHVGVMGSETSQIVGALEDIRDMLFSMQRSGS